MTTIAPFAAGSYRASRNTAQLVALKGQLDTLSTQLATGQTSQTYSGLGSSRTTALSAQSTISALNGYAAGITAAQTRTKVAVTSLTQVSSLGSNTRTGLLAGLQSASFSTTANKVLAQNNLESALDALNQSSGTDYLFGGRNTSTQPVLDASTILNGSTSPSGQALAGLRTLVADQKKADLGSGGNGRLTLTAPAAGATSLSLSEDTSAEARANFGFSIGGASTTGSALTATTTAATASTATATFAAAPTEGQRFRVVVNQADGSQKTLDFTATASTDLGVENPFPLYASPASANPAADASSKLADIVTKMGGTIASVQSAATTDTPPGPGLSLAFSGGSPASVSVGLGTPATQPAVGDTVTVTLKLHDGTSTTLTLTAAAAGSTTSASATGGTFAIGADAAATAANLSSALGSSLTAAANSTLSISSVAKASQDFFAGSPTAGLAPRRIVFDGSGNATGYAQTPQTNTVIWYQGEDGGTDPRATQTVQISQGSTLQTGIRANEAPIANVLAGLATLALGLPDPSDPNIAASYQAIIGQAGNLLASASTSPSVQDRVTDLSLASARLTTAATTNTAARNTLQNTVDGIEQAPTQEVAAKLLDLQNRLQASYQLTSSLSKLSLVNYLS